MVVWDVGIGKKTPPSFARAPHASIQRLVRTSQSRPQPEGEGARGNVFVLRTDQVSIEVRMLLQSAARAVLLSRRGSLAEQVKRIDDSTLAPPPPRQERAATLAKDAPRRTATKPAAPQSQRLDPPYRPPLELEFFNGLGGFSVRGRGDGTNPG